MLNEDELQEAAVLVLRYRENGEELIVLTKRTEEVLHHKGQICFPGGAFDPADENLWATALREAQEEIGLDPKKAAFVRELPKHVTPTQFRVTPFVADLTEKMDWKLNPHETAEVFSVPVLHLSHPDHVSFQWQVFNDNKFLMPSFQYKEYSIWGLTAKILCDLLEIRP